MRTLWLSSLIAIAACGGTAPPSVSPPSTSSSTAHSAIALEPPPTDAEIRQLSQDFLIAYDRGDVAAVEARLAPGLVHFDSGYTSTRDDELARLRKRKPDGPTIASRTWSDVTVRADSNYAVFIGKAAEQESGRAANSGYKHNGWYLLEWERAPGDAWRLRLWTWQRVSEPHEPWNEIYRNGLGFAQEPNRLLVDVIKGQRPGRALDIGMGQGRNALHLAAQGWKVTGVDISDEGIRIARETAAKRKLTLETVLSDVNTYDFGTNRWDLVTMIYEGADPAWIEKAKTSLRPGGLFVFEYFAKDADSDGVGPGDLAALFAGYQIIRDEIVEDVPDWRQARAKLARFVARKRKD